MLQVSHTSRLALCKRLIKDCARLTAPKRLGRALAPVIGPRVMVVCNPVLRRDAAWRQRAKVEGGQATPRHIDLSCP